MGASNAKQRSIEYMTDERDHSPLPAPIRGRPFAKGISGNPGGRRLGSRNKATVLARSILEQATGAITDKTVAAALEGHPLALKLCMDRILPRPRDAMIEMDLPATASAEDCGQAIDAILAAAAAGEIAPAQAEALTAVVE